MHTIPCLPLLPPQTEISKELIVCCLYLLPSCWIFHSEFFLSSLWSLTKIPTLLFHHKKGQLKTLLAYCSIQSQELTKHKRTAVSFGESLFLQDFIEFMYVDQAISTLRKGADIRLQSAGSGMKRRRVVPLEL